MIACRRGVSGLSLLGLMVLATACGDAEPETPPDAVAFSVFEHRAEEVDAADPVVVIDVTRGSSTTGFGNAADGAASTRADAQETGPVIDRLALAPATDDDGGEAWRAVVGVADGDPEHHDFEYSWRVNGEEAFHDADTFPVSSLERGDTLEVDVRASDGFVWSATASSGTIRISNAAPTIDSTPPRLGPDGAFRYALRASDRDGHDDLRFELRKSPEGMTLESGVVTWKPTLAQAGRHEVEVAVVDDHGGESSQTFVLSLVTTGGEPAAPQP